MVEISFSNIIKQSKNHILQFKMLLNTYIMKNDWNYSYLGKLAIEVLSTILRYGPGPYGAKAAL